MNRSVSVLAAGVLLAVAAPAAAQEDVAQAAPDVAALEALCEANASNAPDKGLCLYVVHQLMLPGSDPGAGDHGLGDAQDRDGMMVKPLKVKWNVKLTNPYSMPGKGMKFVGVLVEYTAGEDEDSYLETSWSVSDDEASSYDQPNVGTEPDLGYGRIRPGETVRGWVTFEVPRKAKWLELRYEQPLRDPLYWTIRDKKRK
jgi:hypothetical protein